MNSRIPPHRKKLFKRFWLTSPKPHGSDVFFEIFLKQMFCLPKISNCGPPKHCSCRQIHFDPSKMTLRIRTLYTALGSFWPRSVHYTWYFGRSLKCWRKLHGIDVLFEKFLKFMFYYRAKIATAIHTLYAIHLSFQTRSIHYTRNIKQIFQNTAYSD